MIPNVTEEWDVMEKILRVTCAFIAVSRDLQHLQWLDGRNNKQDSENTKLDGEYCAKAAIPALIPQIRRPNDIVLFA